MSARSSLVAIAEKWISLWTAPVDWQLFDDLHGDDFEDMSPAGRPGTKQGFAQGLSELIHAFPDLRASVRDLVIDTEKSVVAVRWSAFGTNKSRFLGIGPTNNITPIAGIEIIQIQAGRIVRRWGEWDISSHADT